MLKKILVFVFLVLIALFFFKNPDIANKFINFSGETIGSGVDILTGGVVSNISFINNTEVNSNLTNSTNILLNSTNKTI